VTETTAPAHSAATPARFRQARFVLAGSMLVMGACGIIYEYALSVLGNNLMGSSHEQLFVIIGIMMFAMGLGATLQKHLLKDLLDKFLWIELALGLLGGISTLVIFVTFAYTASYHVVMYGFALIIGGLIGLEIPMLIRINETYADSLRTNLSQILCMDYIGSLLGALLFAYVLLSHVSLGRIALALGLVNTCLALIGLVYFWPLVRRRQALAVAILGTAAALAVGFVQADRWVASVEQRCYEDPIVHRETSVYQHVVLTQRGDRLRMYINGHLQFSSKDEAIYHELLVHTPLAVAPQRSRVLILGGGDGLALREVLKYPDVSHVTLVDIDPAVTRLAATQPDLVELNEAALYDARVTRMTGAGLTPGEKIRIRVPTKLREELLERRSYDVAGVRVVHVDADLFVRQIHETYDIAILDFPDPSTIELAKLFSVEFYRALASRLTPDGVLSVQASSPQAAREAYACIGRTLETAGFAALPYHAHVPSFGHWGWYLAAPRLSTDALAARLNALDAIAVSTRHITPDVVRAAFVFGLDWDPAQVDVEPNRKLRPVLVQYYQRGWR
jgi:spermidine synthase